MNDDENHVSLSPSTLTRCCPPYICTSLSPTIFGMFSSGMPILFLGLAGLSADLLQRLCAPYNGFQIMLILRLTQSGSLPQHPRPCQGLGASGPRVTFECRVPWMRVGIVDMTTRVAVGRFWFGVRVSISVVVGAEG